MTEYVINCEQTTRKELKSPLYYILSQEEKKTKYHNKCLACFEINYTRCLKDAFNNKQVLGISREEINSQQKNAKSLCIEILDAYSDHLEVLRRM